MRGIDLCEWQKPSAPEIMQVLRSLSLLEPGIPDTFAGRPRPLLQVLDAPSPATPAFNPAERVFEESRQTVDNMASRPYNQPEP